MDQALIHCFMLSGFLSVVDSREYILIGEYKSWWDARDYCRQNHIDLASAQTDEEWGELNRLTAASQSLTWVGLYDDVNSWRWSFQDESLTFVRWEAGQPDNTGGNQNCVMIHSTGYWRDKSYNLKCVFFCESGGQPLLVNSSQLTWPKAQKYCRENHVDLFTVRSLTENQRLYMMSQSYNCAWIGLYRDGWKWSDHSTLSPSLLWATRQPDNAFENENCAAVDQHGLASDEQCSERFFFICTTWSKVNVLRLEVTAADHVNVELMTAAVLKEVQQKLGESNVKLTWRKQADGMIFQRH